MQRSLYTLKTLKKEPPSPFFRAQSSELTTFQLSAEPSLYVREEKFRDSRGSSHGSGREYGCGPVRFRNGRLVARAPRPPRTPPIELLILILFVAYIASTTRARFDAPHCVRQRPGPLCLHDQRVVLRLPRRAPRFRTSPAGLRPRGAAHARKPPSPQASVQFRPSAEFRPSGRHEPHPAAARLAAWERARRQRRRRRRRSSRSTCTHRGKTRRW